LFAAAEELNRRDGFDMAAGETKKDKRDKKDKHPKRRRLCENGGGETLVVAPEITC